jgi:hypothetical protein
VTLPRRRILRPTPAASNAKLQQMRERLATLEAALARWMMRLRRAFHAVEKHQRRIARVRKSLLAQEANP